MATNKIAHIGIFGGTFDPIHKGHLHILESLAPRFDSLLLIPSGKPRLRYDAPVASGADRVAMCEAALDDLSDNLQSKTSVVDLEINRPGPTYAIDTINQLRMIYPRDTFSLIIGSDAAEKFSQWYRADAIKKIVEIIVIKRPGALKSEFKEIGIGALDISATAVRKSIQENKNVEQFVSPSVLTLIKERGLYGSK